MTAHPAVTTLRLCPFQQTTYLFNLSLPTGQLGPQSRNLAVSSSQIGDQPLSAL
jgi:hypothetical protein